MSFLQERSAQARIMDLEAQLSRSTQNTQQLKRTKDEVCQAIALFLLSLTNRFFIALLFILHLDSCYPILTGIFEVLR